MRTSKPCNLMSQRSWSKVGFAILGSAIALGTLATQGLARPTQPNVGQLNLEDRKFLVPTAPGFARPLKFQVLTKPFITGVLSCSPKDVNHCIVRNMPLINQGDPRLDNDVKDQGNWGCYDTSILTVILTALANRDDSFSALSGRIKELDSIQADAANKIPKEVKQLSWMYSIVKEADKQAQTSNQNVFKLYFPEVLASFKIGKVVESVRAPKCDPYKYGTSDMCEEASLRSLANSFRQSGPGTGGLKTWDNNSITQKMRDGYVLVVAYGRYTPMTITTPLPGGGSKTRIEFQKTSQHKVVFSGFQRGAYPLRINDVGNGARYQVSLKTDLVSRAAIFAENPTAEIVYPTQVKTFLEYEDSVQGEVFFVEHIDGLRVPTKLVQDKKVESLWERDSQEYLRYQRIHHD